MKKAIKVLIIDDSALVRQTLAEIVGNDPQLEVIGKAADPFFAARHIRNEVPDVITLDIEMPRMDGLTFLRTLMARYPVPVVIISSLTQHGSHLALRALELGAIEIVAKSEIKNTREHLEETRIRIVDAIKAAYMAPVRRNSLAVAPEAQKTVSKPIRRNGKLPAYKTTDKVIAVGASTGGTEALRYFLQQMPADAPGILITQHMPAGFTKSFADQVNTLCEITVKEALDGERVMRGHAYIAPGGRHMELVRSGAKYFIKIRDGALVNRHRPSVDVLFNSVAHHAGQNALGIIMTGMGRDGAEGLLKMKEAGARTIAQDEKSSVVFGMPKEAIRIGGADQVLHLYDMPMKVRAFF
ncbi:chemotaxis response regulator protein-glutamate methylesterase [Fulvivirgaceae bacterium PWU4]|uniref:Protein-glutamate methylesterase/protein-glutamine glutaminase n=1 Tax=Chryseosolibacter histidini TaxID=2782349 RepID=A0AAP2GLP8_9BACT|nr:chemotaxis response regulator protein-glutamate methylesterase [Chryseosolibacter histidini]MBT1700656.1 chemotaxis response regulator protein-glutamate methylesterase [Chryseosolibacter histidini]